MIDIGDDVGDGVCVIGVDGFGFGDRVFCYCDGLCYK